MKKIEQEHGKKGEGLSDIGTAGLWACCCVVRRFGFPSPASQVPKYDVRFAQSSQPHWGLLPPHALHQAQIPGRAFCVYL